MNKTLIAALALVTLSAQAQTVPPNTTIVLPSPTTVKLYGPDWNNGCPGGPYVWWPLVQQPEYMCAAVSDPAYSGKMRGSRTETYPNGTLSTVVIDGVVSDALGNTAVYHQTWTGGCGRSCNYAPGAGTLIFNPQ
jgi:hypothetical protein